MRNKVSIGFSSIGLGTILTVVFLILKLCNVIAWEWIFIFLPLIISAGLWLLMVIVVLVLLIIFGRG